MVSLSPTIITSFHAEAVDGILLWSRLLPRSTAAFMCEGEMKSPSKAIDPLLPELALLVF